MIKFLWYTGVKQWYLQIFLKNTTLQILKFLHFLLAYFNSFLINDCFSSTSINAKKKFWVVPCILQICMIFQDQEKLPKMGQKYFKMDPCRESHTMKKMFSVVTIRVIPSMTVQNFGAKDWTVFKQESYFKMGPKIPQKDSH